MPPSGDLQENTGPTGEKFYTPKKELGPGRWPKMSDDDRNQVYESTKKALAESLSTADRESLSAALWTEVASPAVNYKVHFDATDPKLKGMPISSAILLAATQAQEEGLLTGRKPKEVMFYCLDYLQNADRNNMVNIDLVDKGDTIDIYTDANGEWKLKVTKKDGTVRMDGWLFPPPPEDVGPPDGGTPLTVDRVEGPDGGTPLTVDRSDGPTDEGTPITVDRVDGPDGGTPLTVDRSDGPTDEGTPITVDRADGPDGGTPLTVERVDGPTDEGTPITVDRADGPDGGTPLTVERVDGPTDEGTPITVDRADGPAGGTPLTVDRSDGPTDEGTPLTVERTDGPIDEGTPLTVDGVDGPIDEGTPLTVERADGPTDEGTPLTVERTDGPTDEGTPLTVDGRDGSPVEGTPLTVDGRDGPLYGETPLTVDRAGAAPREDAESDDEGTSLTVDRADTEYRPKQAVYDEDALAAYLGTDAEGTPLTVDRATPLDAGMRQRQHDHFKEALGYTLNGAPSGSDFEPVALLEDYSGDEPFNIVKKDLSSSVTDRYRLLMEIYNQGDPATSSKEALHTINFLEMSGYDQAIPERLEGVASWKVRGGMLYLYDSEGNSALIDYPYIPLRPNRGQVRQMLSE